MSAQAGLFEALFGAARGPAPASRVPKGKTPNPAFRPEGAISVMRPDTKRSKEMGWALVSPTQLDIYLELVVQRPNEGFRGMSPGAMMGMRAAQRRTREWSLAAFRQATVPQRRPARVTLVRISSGHMDDDGLVASFKHVRDACAMALGFDDREFSIGGMRPGAVPIFYEQKAPGVRGVKGMRIEIRWETTDGR